MELSYLLSEMVKYVDGEVKIEILERDKYDCVIRKKTIPFAFVSPNHSGEGVKIKIEQSDIDDAKWVKF